MKLVRGCLLLGAAVLLLMRPDAAGSAGQELGALVSPGALSRPHAKLEGLANCQKCHDTGKQVPIAKCLVCHEPVAKRIAAKAGVHRNVSKDCVPCHTEHGGANAELRPVKTRGFDHATETGFALEGLHAPLAEKCASCHKVRSFLGLQQACASCHTDAHKGVLGTKCATCHAMNVAFKDTKTAFDHSKTPYALTGAHLKVACATCHPRKEYRVARFAACDDCHKNPHQPALGACANCHVTDSFRTVTNGKFDHARTGYPLRERHAAVPCASCHVQPAAKVRLKAAHCADCHRDVHRGAFKAAAEDCGACHSEAGFKGGRFDHAKRTKYPLADKHLTVPCASCHKGAAATPGVLPANRTVLFAGAKAECRSCHEDVHRGQLGNDCQTCHSPAGFKVPGFRHPRSPEFFVGGHAGVACEKCHDVDASAGLARGPGNSSLPVRKYRGVPLVCSTCHKDPHFGQVGSDCATCHTVAGKKFAPELFVHSRSRFALTGKHVTTPCANCHKKETGTFPAGSGTAVRLTGLAAECRACHKDVHLGQLGGKCETCHETATFSLPRFVHPARKETEGLFTEGHAKLQCAACHKKQTTDFPAGQGTAVRYRPLSASCVSCHEDKHRPTLGSNCASCHTPTVWKTASRAFHKAAAFPLEGRHLSVACASCHLKGTTKTTPKQCYDCHWMRRQDDKFKTRLGNECQTCHTPTSWVAVRWEHATQTGFELSTPHKSVACESCHKQGVFRGTSTDCVSCHRSDYDHTQNPNHGAGGFPLTCQSCHSVSSPTFHGATFSHTTFPLAGVHVSQACASCHKTGVYKGTPRDCYTCHQADYQRSASPNHVAAGFLTTCDSCHRFADPSWKGATFSHTTFPLAGVHVTQTCAACHKNNVYKGASRDCYTCHQADYQKSANPGHVAAGFPTACDSCHKFSDPAWKPASFNHNTATTYPLVGLHATQLCATCHKNNVFKGTSRECYTCHQPDFQQSQNPNHVAAGFPTACDTCHKPSDSAWKPASFNHNTATTFQLAGVHTTQTCATCHKNNVFKGTGRDCFSCHQSDYQKSANPNHVAAGFPTACDSCHKFSDSAWKPLNFNHSTATTFPLAGVHVTQTCATCHKNNVFKGTARDCFSCHQSDYQKSVNPNHVASGFPTTCDSCHKFADPSWKGATFAHTTFPLAGVHVTQTCATCHKNGVYKGTPRDCYSCHQADYQKSVNPNHVAAGFPTACDTCHKFSDPAWKPASFNHNTATTFPLAGVHVAQTCATCHKNGVYKGTPRDCYSCHQSDYQKSVNPNHVAAGFPTACDTCHKFSDPAWKPASFSHSSATTYPLVGLHATQVCSACHKNNVYKGTPRDCYTCHQALYTATTNPNHVATGFPTTCDSCHKPTDPNWLVAVFNHSTATTFPLVGLHATQVCSACHKNNVYKGTPRDCYTCHQALYTATTNPNHVATGFPTTCDSCHKPTDPNWLVAVFNHSTATTYPLVGLHATQVCSACHKNNVYKGTPRDCYTCHQALYTATTNPNHISTGFPTTCDSCHKPTDANWLVAVFNHSTATTYPLVGLHATQVCSACHKNNVYKGTPRDCYTCHQALYTATTTPNHIGAGFPTTCDSCHKPTDPNWLLAVFNHTTSTTFPLVGVHATQTCATCHASGVYKGLSTLCSSCHLPLYNATKSPNHIATGFPTTCDNCHKATDPTWLVAVFNHTTSTTFPLVGVHATQTCATCHASGVYKGLSTLCSSCHLALYNATKTPPHASTGFPTTCDNCHKATDPTWLVAVFNHTTSTTFPLVGVHATQTCATCHASGVYKGLSTLCSSCHLALYNATKTPPHASTGFPTTCDNCHKATDPTWLVAVFSHTWFPITSGNHNQPCSTCHTTPTNYALFLCTQCHTQSQITPHHSGVKGFVWNSVNCYACHPTGRAG